MTEPSSQLLVGLDLDELDQLATITCAIRSGDYVVGYVNPAWHAFGRDNGATRAWGPGDSVLAGIADPLRAFYEDHFATAIATGTPWEHDYECSSAELYRLFHLRAVVLGDHVGLLITHALRVEHLHAAPLSPAELALYHGKAGLVSQCGHCRRVRRVAPPRTWDWVPELVAHPARATTHGLCESCLAYYFGPAALGPSLQ